MEIKSELKSCIIKLDWRLILILIIYVTIGLFLLVYYQYQINPDGVGYIHIAEEYMGGNFYGSVNAYWGPLLSWLLMPFLYFNQSPTSALYSTKLLSLIVGFFTIIGVRQLSYRFEMMEIIRSAILLTVVPITLYFSLSVITPDLLILCILVYYFAIIFNPNYSNKLSNGLLCGALGAVAYLGKSFIFTFFIAHFLIMNIFHYYKYVETKQRKNVSRNLILGFLTFLVISGVWVGLISAKDGEFTFGTAGEYNHDLVGPQSNGYPQLYQGLSAPGEVKNQNQAVKHWSPFTSWSNFNYQLKLIWANIQHVLSILQYYSYLSITILIVYLLLFIGLLNRINLYKQKNLQENLLYPLVTLIIYIGLYMPILVEERYIWPVYIMLLLMGGYLIYLFFKTELFGESNYFGKLRIENVTKGVILLIFAFSFIIMPFNFLISNLNTGKDIYTLSNTLESQYNVHGNVATNDRLIDTQYISFYLNTTSYGQAQKNIGDNELQTQLAKYNIDYYFIWCDSAPHALSGYREINYGKTNDLIIFTKD